MNTTNFPSRLIYLFFNFRPSTFIETSNKRKAEDGDDVFHFVSYIHFKNSIYEIDGL